jgi:hypothetical protein
VSTPQDDKTSHWRLSGALQARTEYRFGLVLILLLATFLFLMVGATSPWTRPVIVALTGTTLVSALFAAEVSLRLRRIAAAVALIATVISIVVIGVHGSEADGAVALVDAALVALAPVAIGRSVIRRHVIDVQTVLAALCIYVLLAMLWSFVYFAIGRLGSSPFFEQSMNPTSADYAYFSFITQTTVGYGDLTAAGNFGRACAVLEALLGQIYLVTVVSVLVSRLRPRVSPGTPTTET